MNRPDECADCGRGPLIPQAHWQPGMRGVPYAARGLCRTCRTRHRTNGTINNYAALKQDRAVFLDNYRFLTSQGCTNHDIARQLSMTDSALKRMLARARHDGQLPRNDTPL